MSSVLKIAVCLAGVCMPMAAEADSLQADSLATVAATDTSTTTSRNIFQKVSDYFADSNKFNPEKKIDFSLIGGPFYASATGLGLGVVASGLYTLDRDDPTLPLSNLSIFGNVATSGMLAIGLRGNNIFPREKYKFDYAIYVYTFPSKFWGIGYDSGNDDANETSYSRIKFEVKPRFMFRLFDNAYIGPLVNFQYVKITDLDDAVIRLANNDPDDSFMAFGGGATFTYDSRDVITNATKGWLFQLDGVAYPSAVGNEREYYMVDLTVASYKRAWKGAVIAGEFHSLLNFNDVPWPMLAGVGGPNRMRGYFEGRYRDKCIMEFQLELRQHIWRRNGAVLWVGAANVFPEFESVRLKKTLLNAGIGYRWAFKQDVNVRLDLGFTKNGMGFAFNINEAF